MTFPIKIPNKASFIIILNIDTKTVADHYPIVGGSTPANIINPIMLATFSLFVLPSIPPYSYFIELFSMYQIIYNLSKY